MTSKLWTDYTELTAISSVDTLLGFDVSETTVGSKMKQIPAAFLFLPDGVVMNGRIAPTAAAGALTLTLQTAAGGAPSSTDPVIIKLNGTIHAVVAPLSVTMAAATNWMNAGASETATKEMDLFVYIGYNATDGVVLGVSRIPCAAQYSDFNTTSTNEKYARISTITTAASTDPYAVIGRFAATLSASAAYTWTVPSYTPINLVQRPVYETRWLTLLPTYTGNGSLTYGTVTTTVGKYKFINDRCKMELVTNGTTGGTTNNQLIVSLPITCIDDLIVGSAVLVDGGGIGGFLQTTAKTVTVSKADASNWGLGSGRIIRGVIEYQIG